VENFDGTCAHLAIMKGMSFEDLPPNVRELPLTDPRLAGDVIDLIVSEESRHHGSFGIMMCDDRDRGVKPILFSDKDEVVNLEGVTQLLRLVLPLVAEIDGAVLLGRGRRRGLQPDDTDRAWHQRAIDLCAEHGVRLLGFHVATRDGVFALPEPLTAAS
jgi:hypothetical protein